MSVTAKFTLEEANMGYCPSIKARGRKRTFFGEQYHMLTSSDVNFVITDIIL